MNSIEIDLAEHLDGCQKALEYDGRFVFVDEDEIINYAKANLEVIDGGDKDEVREAAEAWFQVFEDDAAVIEYAVEEWG